MSMIPPLPKYLPNSMLTWEEYEAKKQQYAAAGLRYDPYEPVRDVKPARHWTDYLLLGLGASVAGLLVMFAVMGSLLG